MPISGGEREYHRAYRLAHKEEISAYQRAYGKANKDKLSDYHKSYYQKNKDAMNSQSRAYYHANREEILVQQRTTKFGLASSEYDKLLTNQGGACAICGTEPNGRALAVDHNHDTGLVRGLLCHHCNTAIGLLDDSPERLIRAIEYLEM